MSTKASQLKNLLMSNQLEYFLESHNGLSAKIVQEAGFKGIWASGLAISSAFGVRDCNEASWTQVLETLEFMSDVTDIPILLDADTGYGNFNNVRRLIKKLEQRSVAGVCIEDKIFPKTNSFINGNSQSLAPVEEFCGKIKAAKDTQVDKDFCVVARTEAFIVGKGLEEALERCTKYYQAGADAVLVHSACTTAEQIILFMQHWQENCPVIIVPTAYYKTPTQVFKELGIRLILWANHMVRASIYQMQKVATIIYQQESVEMIDAEIVPLKEVFKLQNFEELHKAENKYLPS
jgi:phosphoenolpyruvate phosphomutase